MMNEPEQIAALQAALGQSAANLAYKFDRELASCESLTRTLLSFIQDNVSSLSRKQYCFVLDMAAFSDCKLDPRVIAGHIASGQNRFNVTFDAHLANVNTIAGKAAASQISKEKSSYVIFVSGTTVTQFLDGIMLNDEQDILSTMVSINNSAIRSYPIYYLEQIVEEHYKECILNEKRVRYWSDKGKRILKSNQPDGTEMLFHKDLYWWMDHYVIDKIRIYAEPKMTGVDKTDIVLVDSNATSHVIEVKWLGTNDAGTTYDQSRIDEGVRQVSLYLDNDLDFVRGYLVIYDARTEADFKSKSRHTVQLHIRCAEPIIKFLENETPSKKAKHA